jgi:hypothetical protein
VHPVRCRDAVAFHFHPALICIQCAPPLGEHVGGQAACRAPRRSTGRKALGAAGHALLTGVGVMAARSWLCGAKQPPYLP